MRRLYHWIYIAAFSVPLFAFLSPEVIATELSTMTASASIAATASVRSPIGILSINEENTGTLQSCLSGFSRADRARLLETGLQLIRTGNPAATLVTIESPSGTTAYLGAANLPSGQGALFRGPGQSTLFFICPDEAAVSLDQAPIVISISRIDN